MPRLDRDMRGLVLDLLLKQSDGPDWETITPGKGEGWNRGKERHHLLNQDAPSKLGGDREDEERRRLEAASFVKNRAGR